MTFWEPGGDGLRLHCHIQPRASACEITGIHNDRLRIRLTAPPADNRANEQLVKLVAKRLGVTRNRVTILRGHNNRTKTLEIGELERPPPDFP